MNISSLFFPRSDDKRESDLFDSLNKFYIEVKSILNRGASFDDNIDCRLVSFTSNAVATNDTEVTHTLGKIPSGYIIYSQDKAGSLYLGSGTWTATKIYVASDVASVAFKIIAI